MGSFSPVSKLLTSGELARNLGVVRSTVSRWVKDGLIAPEVVTAGGQSRLTLSKFASSFASVPVISGNADARAQLDGCLYLGGLRRCVVHIRLWERTFDVCGAAVTIGGACDGR